VYDVKDVLRPSCDVCIFRAMKVFELSCRELISGPLPVGNQLVTTHLSFSLSLQVDVFAMNDTTFCTDTIGAIDW